MFLRRLKRFYDGKTHYSWSVVENRRLIAGRIAQRHLLYLGEVNGMQKSSWRRTVELFGQDNDAPRQVALFPEDHVPVQSDDGCLPVVRIKLSEMPLLKSKWYFFASLAVSLTLPERTVWPSYEGEVGRRE